MTRFFVSYATSGDKQGAKAARQFIYDLQIAGAQVVTADATIADDELVEYLNQQLPGCQYCVLVQTPQALQSPRVQATLDLAFNLVAQQRMRGVLCLVAGQAERQTASLPLFSSARARIAALADPPPVLTLSPVATDLPPVLALPPVAADPLLAPIPRPVATGALPVLAPSPVAAGASPVLAPPSVPARPSVVLAASPARPHAIPGRVPASGDHPRPLLWWQRSSIRSLAIEMIAASLLLAMLLAVWTAGAPPVPSNDSPSGPVSTAALARDTFQRADQRGWGRASGGAVWSLDATNPSLFSIQHDQGVITSGQGGQGALSAILGPPISGAEILLTGSISSFNNANLGALLRWVNPTTFYKAYIDGQQFILLKDRNGQATTLATTPFDAQAHRFYDLRFRVQGSTLAARVWPAGTPEPGQWMISAQDRAIPFGFGGLRTITEPGITFVFTAFWEIPLPR